MRRVLVRATRSLKSGMSERKCPKLALESERICEVKVVEEELVVVVVVVVEVV